MQIEVWRQGEARKLDVTVGEVPNAEGQASRRGLKSEPQAPGKANWLGMVATDLDDSQRKSQDVARGGVVIASLDPAGIAAQAGLRQGDVLLQLNSQPITSASQFEGLLGKLDRKRTLVLLVRRGGETSYLPVRP